MRLSLTLWLLMLLGLSLPVATHAQICTPDPNAPNVGLFPSTLPPACPGQPYSVTVTLGVPSDTFGLPITNVVINNILDLPAGITYACEPSTCIFPGGTKGCIVLSGTPTTAGTALIDVEGTVNSLTSLNFTLTDTLALVVGYSGTVVTTDASCGATDGSATIDLSGSTGVPPFSFAWSDSQTDSIADNLAAGPYTVDVTDANNCTVTFNVSVSSTGGNPAVIDSAASGIGWVGCHDANGGFINPSVSGGAGPLSYSWASGQGVQDIDNLAGGIYTLTVTGTDNCVTSQTFTITPPPAMSASATSTDATCFGEATGTATASVQGGEAPFSFSWTPAGQIGSSITGLDTGTYVVTVEDGNGCERTASTSITQPDSLILILASTAVSAPGANDGTATVGSSGGTGQVTFDWGSAGTGGSLTGLAPGTYTVVATDANGCTTVDSVEVDGVTSLSFSAQKEAVLVYPNPSQGLFHIKLALNQPQALTMRVCDLSGRTVMEQAAAASEEFDEVIDLQDAPKGVYLLDIQLGSERATTRLIVE